MAIPVLILGKSGSGKSASMRNFKAGELGVINVMGKPLPFKNSFTPANSTDYGKIMAVLNGAKVHSIAIDDAGYLITNEFMTRHSTTGKGNAVFELYNDLADNFYSLIRFIVEKLPEGKIVYLMMHEEKNDFGDVKPKTIGKLLDEKVCLEGMFTIVLRAAINGQGKHVFATQSSGFDVAKSPMGMFNEIEIDNDLKAVDVAIREYYGFTNKTSEQEGK
jgi:hypothetical protein